jgi:hypothetical protein
MVEFSSIILDYTFFWGKNLEVHSAKFVYACDMRVIDLSVGDLAVDEAPACGELSLMGETEKNHCQKQ